MVAKTMSATAIKRILIGDLKNRSYISPRTLSTKTIKKQEVEPSGKWTTSKAILANVKIPHLLKLAEISVFCDDFLN